MCCIRGFFYWFCTLVFLALALVFIRLYDPWRSLAATSVQHKSPQRDLWPLIQPKRIKMLVLGGEQTRTIELKHFIMLIFFTFCILLYSWEFECSLRYICISVWSLCLHSCLKQQLSCASILYHQQCGDSQTWTRMQRPFLASQTGWCSPTHFCCDHYLVFALLC